jgi:LysM repeat protein
MRLGKRLPVGRPVAQAQATQSLSIVTLALQGAEPVYSTFDDPDTGRAFLHYTVTLAADQIARTPQGQVDRSATARNIAQQHYAGFSSLDAPGQARVVAYVQSLLPDNVTAGQKLAPMYTFIDVGQSRLSAVTQITDHSVRQIGADGQSLPSGAVQNHQVRQGDSLQSIAQLYFGSASYWYLIADANGLQGTESLAEGQVLSIPNSAITNSVNNASSFKVYNESEIIGSTSPEIRTHKKKKRWYQKLIQIVIVVIAVVAAVVTVGAGLAAVGALGANAGALLTLGANIAGAIAGTLGVTLGAVGVATIAVAGLAGAAIGAAANVLSQGLAIAVDLQDDFDWKAVGQAAAGGAASAAAAGLTAGWTKGAELGSFKNIATRVAVEAGKQQLTDGKISSVAGLIGAAIGGGAFKDWGTIGQAIGNNARTVTAGLSLLESKLRGQGDNAMLWVGLATSALFDSSAFKEGAGNDGQTGQASRSSAPSYYNNAGQLDWRAVAVQTVGAAVIAEQRGGDAARAYLGGALGEFAIQAGDRAYARYQANAAARQMREHYGQDGTGDVLSNHNGERLSLDNGWATTTQPGWDIHKQAAIDRALAQPGRGMSEEQIDSMRAPTAADRYAEVYGGEVSDAADKLKLGFDSSERLPVPKELADKVSRMRAINDSLLNLLSGNGTAVTERVPARASDAARGNSANAAARSAETLTTQLNRDSVIRETVTPMIDAASGYASPLEPIGELGNLIDAQFGGTSGQTPAALPVLGDSFGQAVGAVQFAGQAAVSTAQLVSDSLLQLGNSFTAGLNNDSPVIQDALTRPRRVSR